MRHTRDVADVVDVVDVVIIGGGVMGCAVALRLAQRGMTPLVLERSVPGAEASSAAAGILSPQAECDSPGPLLDLGLASRALFPSLVAELEAQSGIDVGHRICGVLSLSTESGVDALARKAAWQEAAGLEVQRLSPAELRAVEPNLATTDESEGSGAPASLSLRFPSEGQVQPRRLMRALALTAARAGVEFATAYVRRVLHDGQKVTGVELDDRTIESPRVVVAAGSWSGLVDGAGLPSQAVRPMRGQLVELSTRPPLLSHVVFTPGGYLVPRADGRVVVGSTMELVGFRKEVTAGGLERLLGLARRTVPLLADAAVGASWSNFRPYTDDHLPFLGKTPIRGLHLATGHFRNGILLLPVTANAVAATVCDEPPAIDLAPFSITRLPQIR